MLSFGIEVILLLPSLTVPSVIQSLMIVIALTLITIDIKNIILKI